MVNIEEPDEEQSDLGVNCLPSPVYQTNEDLYGYIKQSTCRRDNSSVNKLILYLSQCTTKCPVHPVKAQFSLDILPV